MKKYIFSLFVLLFTHQLFSQNDSTTIIGEKIDSLAIEDIDLSFDEDTTSNPPLLPPKMMFTQKILWGERGIVRRIGLVPLTTENRVKELKWRRRLLITHQVVGYGTIASIIGTAITGQMLYNGKDIKPVHTTFATITNGGYIVGASIALFNTPSLKSRTSKTWSNIDWHKFFAYSHLTGMIVTNILSGQAADKGGDWRTAHEISGFFTAITFTAAFISIKF